MRKVKEARGANSLWLTDASNLSSGAPSRLLRLTATRTASEQLLLALDSWSTESTQAP